MEYIINTQHLKKSFKNSMVLNDVNLSCKQGEICGIVGRNGSGKTVLFKIICGFLKPDEGQVFVKDKDLKKRLLDMAGIIIEHPAFLGNQSGYKNLEFLYMIRQKSDKAHLYEIMKMVGLDPASRKKVRNYSLGMRQRLAIAQAIMEDQEILILDEPMNGLDNAGVIEIRKLLLALKDRGRTILLASHNKEDIEVLCDSVYEMDRGSLVKITD